MKITRRQLRRLIAEAKFTPKRPLDRDAMQIALGIHPDQLQDANPPLRMTVWISKNPFNPYDQSFTHEFVVPHHLVDELIEEHNNIQSYDVSGLIVAAREIEKHLMADLSQQFPGHVIDEFTPSIKGYRAEEYRSAWYEAMEYYSVGGH